MLQPEEPLFNGFAMASDAARFLATVMFPHAFQPTELEELVKRGNRFIRAMRKDTPYWSSFPLFSRRRPAHWQSRPTPTAAMLLETLRQLPIVTRAHFFDVAGGRYNRKSLAEATSYMTRKRGLDGLESASLLERSGIVTREQDPVSCDVASAYKESTEWALQEIDRRVPFWQLWAGFGLRQDKADQM
jgi:hypothetical protein